MAAMERNNGIATATATATAISRPKSPPSTNQDHGLRRAASAVGLFAVRNLQRHGEDAVLGSVVIWGFRIKEEGQ